MFAQRSNRQGGEVQNIFHMTFIHFHFELMEEHNKNRVAGPVLGP